MSVTLSNEKSELIKQIATGQGFKDYTIEVKVGSVKGDGYLGIINTVHIEEKKKNKDLNLIMKSAMSGDKLRETAPVSKAYDREIFMYQTIFPELRKFSEENGIKTQFTETAKCYGSLFQEKEECIILENLKEIGFKLWNRKEPMNGDHVAMVFTSYAKFHGTSLALKNLQPEKFEEFSKNLFDIFEKENEPEEDKKRFLESTKQIFQNGFRAVAGNENATKALTKFAQSASDFFFKEMKEVNKYCCILHGDCWCNNMMFKYTDLENPLKPTEMCFLDWQISSVGSPIQDLSYFFYACGSKEVLYDLKKYLKIYHETLSNVLKEAGLNPKDIFTFEELENQWKKFSKFGLFMTLFVMRVILSEAEEAPDLSELANKGKDILESIISSESVNVEAMDKRIADIIVFMYEFGYL